MYKKNPYKNHQIKYKKESSNNQIQHKKEKQPSLYCFNEFGASSQGVTGPTFSFDAAGSSDIDGLGRLKSAAEVLTDTAMPRVAVTYNLIYDYDMRSQITDATNNNVDSSTWDVDYAYHDNGDIDTKTVDSTKETDYSYTGNQIDDASSASGGDSFLLYWDNNGNMKGGVAGWSSLVYNWDGKLKSADYDPKLIQLRYDPMGNRIFKDSTEAGKHKYIVDIVGDLPVILLEIDTDTDEIDKTYI